METDHSIEKLFSELFSYERIIPNLVEQAHKEGGDKIIEYLVSVPYTSVCGFSESDMYNAVARIKEGNLESEMSAVVFEDGDIRTADEETDIIEKLRECCDAFGKEKHKNLMKSAECLLELGKMYMKNALAGNGNQQKLNFIKSSALMVGARIRFEKLGKTKQQQNAVNELCRLRKKIMNIPRLKGEKNVDIFEVSQEVKGRLENYRREVAGELDQIGEIEKNNVEKIAQMENICEKSTKYYLHIMATVAELCERIMGKPPCRFSIIGLGSLARKEVTLYSDFEHAIVLEDPEPGTEIDLDAREYFRWFTTIFHIIIIGLGETVIPSVYVKSLCDFFRDEYTPCGVSFDGMMPHACKIPLGRTEPTELRRHVVELIQPVSTMVNFLTKEEEIKNGYFLSDVLSKCCYVFGCSEIYDLFCQKSHLLVLRKPQKDVVKQQLKNIFLNPNETMQNSLQFTVWNNRNVKVSSYRPLTTFLSCIATLCRIDARSSFEIVNEMKERSVINQDWHEKLKYAVAVTMEIRMKTYQMTGHQRKNLTNPEVANIVGEASAHDCHVTLNSFTRMAKYLVFRCRDESINYNNITLPAYKDNYWQSVDEAFVLLSFGKTSEAIELGLKLACETFRKFERAEISSSVAQLVLPTVIRCLISGMLQTDARNVSKTIEEWIGDPGDILYPKRPELKKAEELAKFYRSLVKYGNRQIKKLSHDILSGVYRHQNRHQQSFDEFEKGQATSIYSQSSFELGLESFHRAMAPVEMLNRIKRTLAVEKNFGRRCFLTTGKCHALLQLGVTEEARKELYTLSTEVHSKARLLGKTVYQMVLEGILAIQAHNRFLFDAQYTRMLLSETTAIDFNEDLKMFTPLMRDSITEKAGLISNALNPPGLFEAMSKSTNQRTQKTRHLHEVSFGVLKVHSTSTYAELIRTCHSMIDRFRRFDFHGRLSHNAKILLFLQYASCFMALFEKVRFQQIEFVASQIQSAQGRLRAYKPLQPFIYACFADFLSSQCRTHNGGAAGMTLLQKVACDQHRIFKAVFGCGPCTKAPRACELALMCYTNFQFVSCAKLLWKILQNKNFAGSIQARSTELFVTTVLTVIILQKRQKPTKCFEKTREISFFQGYYLRSLSTGDLQMFSERRLLTYRLFCYHSNPLAPVYNLAIEHLHVNGEKGLRLLWKIIHAPKVTCLVWNASFTRFTQEMKGNLSFKTNIFGAVRNYAAISSGVTRNTSKRLRVSE